jgi:hypothetical protein
MIKNRTLLILNLGALAAVGACAGMVTPRAIVRDLFSVNDVPRIL